jgi:flagellar hook-length control protein FliK
MAESERVHSSSTTPSISLPSRKRFGGDVSAKRFQEELLNLDFFSARSSEPIDPSASATEPLQAGQPITDSSPTATEKQSEPSDQSDEEEPAESQPALSESYPLLCNPTSCRAPENAPVDAEGPSDEDLELVAVNSQQDEQDRSQRQPIEQPVARQGETTEADSSVIHTPTSPADNIESAEQQTSPVDSNPKSSMPETSDGPPIETKGDAEPKLSEWSSTQTMVENEGRPRPKRQADDSKRSAATEETSAQRPATNDEAPNPDGIQLSAGWKEATDEQTVPKMERQDSDANPKSRRADRLERDKRSGRDESKSSETNVSESLVDSDGTASQASDATTPFAIQADAILNGQTGILTEVVTAGFTDPSAASVTTTGPQTLATSVTPSLTTNPSASDWNAAGATATNGIDSASPLGASFSSSNDGQRVGSTAGTQTGTSSVRGSLTPYQESKLVQRVMRGFEQLNEGGGQVRLRLHPPELGTLQMTLRIESMQVFARLEVENTVARDALIQNAQALKDQLAAQGFEVERFEVEIRSEVGGDSAGLDERSDQRGENPRWQTLESRYAVMQSNRITEGPRDPQSAPARTPWFRNGNNLDLTV